MFIDEFTSTTDHQLTQVLSTLKHIHGIEINFNKTTDRQLLKLQGSTRRARDVIIENSEFNSWLTNPEYTKNVLILEAVRLYLAEIAPKRRPKTSKMYEDQQEPEMPMSLLVAARCLQPLVARYRQLQIRIILFQ